jgi:hypothetical protein
MRHTAASREACVIGTRTAHISPATIESTEIGTGLWLLEPPGDLDAAMTRGLRNACIAVLDRGGTGIVLELTDVDDLCEEACDVLATVAETLRARGGLLWLARAGHGGYSYDLQAVDERGLAAAHGFCPGVDSALSRGAGA